MRRLLVVLFFLVFGIAGLSLEMIPAQESLVLRQERQDRSPRTERLEQRSGFRTEQRSESDGERDSGFSGGKRLGNRREARENFQGTGPESPPMSFRPGGADAEESLRRIPWKMLSARDRAKIQALVANPSIYRRLPEQAVYCDPDIFNYLLDHPDMVIAFWEQMGVTQISLREIAPNRYRLRENAGTSGLVNVLYRDPHLVIVHCKGSYQGPVLARTIEGDSLLIMRNRFALDSSGEPFVVSRVDAFVTIHNPGADLIAKILSNMVGRIADANFEQTIGFVGSVSDAAARHPAGLDRMVSRLEGIRPEVLSGFRKIIAGSTSGEFPEHEVVRMPETRTEKTADSAAGHVLNKANDLAVGAPKPLPVPAKTPVGEKLSSSEELFPQETTDFFAEALRELEELPGTAEKVGRRASSEPMADAHMESPPPIDGESARHDFSPATPASSVQGRVLFKKPTLPRSAEDLP